MQQYIEHSNLNIPHTSAPVIEEHWARQQGLNQTQIDYILISIGANATAKVHRPTNEQIHTNTSDHHQVESIADLIHIPTNTRQRNTPSTNGWGPIDTTQLLNNQHLSLAHDAGITNVDKLNDAIHAVATKVNYTTLNKRNKHRNHSIHADIKTIRRTIKEAKHRINPDNQQILDTRGKVQTL